MAANTNLGGGSYALIGCERVNEWLTESPDQLQDSLRERQLLPHTREATMCPRTVWA